MKTIVALVLSVLLMTMGSVAVAATPAHASEQDAVGAIQSLGTGEELVLGNALVTRTAQGLVVNVLNQDKQASADATFCGMALAAAIIAIGAGALGIIAASTGAGTVIIAGFTLTGAQVGMLAGFSGSYAAVLGWISRYVC